MFQLKAQELESNEKYAHFEERINTGYNKFFFFFIDNLARIMFEWMLLLSCSTFPRKRRAYASRGRDRMYEMQLCTAGVFLPGSATIHSSLSRFMRQAC